MPPIAANVTGRQVLALLPAWLRRHLAGLLRQEGLPLYLTGGVVRDLLLGLAPADIDLTVPAGARDLAGRLATRTGGAYVELGRDEDAARVVCKGVTVDCSSFREAAVDIETELTLRDLTVNALALRIDALLMGPGGEGDQALVVIDPTGGLRDLEGGWIRMAGPDSFRADPLRLVRVFRFAATLGFAVEPQTLLVVRRQRALLVGPAPERIAHELDLIMASHRAHATFAALAETGLLWEIVPELQAGVGMDQPASHHLDVFGHSLEALGQMERLVAAPGVFFPDDGGRIEAHVASGRNRVRLLWAALLHDLGKPPTCAIKEDRGGRITFYNHDRAGATLFRQVARRLRWSNEDTERVAGLISEHMRPFHLANVARAAELTLRAAIRMVRAAGDDLPGLFLLAMADALAGQGPMRIEGMEEELARLYHHLETVRAEHVAPVQTGPPLLTGRDLIERLGLVPGPLFKEILAAVEEARMEGAVRTFDQALRLASDQAAGRG